MTLQQTPTVFEERDLITAAKQGDSAAFKTIYETHRDGVYNLITYSLDNPRSVEDVLQIVFMKIYRGLPGFRFESSLATWIYRVTINECQNQNRSRNSRFVSFDAIAGSGEEIDASAIPENVHAHRERQEIIQQAVMALSPKLRAVVVLKYVEELSYEEIAEARINSEENDLSFTLVENPRQTRPFIVCEIIGPMRLALPLVGSRVRVYGVSRYDRQPDHQWYEVHPVIKIETISQ